MYGMKGEKFRKGPIRDDDEQEVSRSGQDPYL